MSCFLFPFPCWIWKEIASEDFFFHCGFASKRKRKHLLRFLSMVWPKEDPFHHALSATLRPMGKDALSTALATCFLRWFQPTARCIARLPKGRSKEAKHKNNSKSEAHSSTIFESFSLRSVRFFKLTSSTTHFFWRDQASSTAPAALGPDKKAEKNKN